MIIKQIIGDRKENVYYREYNFTTNRPASGKEKPIYGNDDIESFGNNSPGVGFDDTCYGGVTLDDWRYPYPPFAIPPYMNIMPESFRPIGNC